MTFHVNSHEIYKWNHVKKLCWCVISILTCDVRTYCTNEYLYCVFTQVNCHSANKWIMRIVWKMLVPVWNNSFLWTKMPFIFHQCHFFHFVQLALKASMLTSHTMKLHFPTSSPRAINSLAHALHCSKLLFMCSVQLQANNTRRFMFEFSFNKNVMPFAILSLNHCSLPSLIAENENYVVQRKSN